MKHIRGRSVWTDVLALMGGAGIAIFFSGYAFPVYSDYPRASALKLDACGADSRVITGWHDQLEALETLRHPLMQSGLSLLLAAITMLVLGQLFRHDERPGLRTPAKRWPFFLLGIGVLGLSFMAQVFSLYLDYRRGEFPWCADSIAIPLFGLIAFYTWATLLCLVIGGALAIFLRDLPQPMGAWCSERPVESLAISLPFVLIAAAIAAIMVLSAPTSAFVGTPASITALYLVEATRSGLVARLNVEPQPA